MAVDQTGENILFVIDESFVEAHIQIQYDPSSGADQFAWVVPVMRVPEFSVGSDRLFDNMLAASVPSYGWSRDPDSCGGGGGGDGSGTDGGGESTGFDDDTGGDGPEVVLQEIVGAFEVTVLQGGTADEVNAWLSGNGYLEDPAATPILGEYLADGFLFAAFKLQNDAEVAEIHPITLRFRNETEACVPLRLTRIAAVDDMEVRTFFLSEFRVVPRGYKHVLVNPLKLDWPNLASNYRDVISAAVDADMANGNAFVTEYAGPSDIVSDFGISSGAWSATPFETIDPVDVVDTLTSQGLMNCTDPQEEGDASCAFDHALLRGLLQGYLPVPDGLDELDFYACLSCYETEIDRAAWDGAAFAAAMQERIIDPGAHASQLLRSYPTLTRMYTTISPEEMMADPLFTQNPDLPDVDLRNQVATRRTPCEGGQIYTLPDGREVYVASGVWPEFDEEMPWEEDVEETSEVGAPIALVDNTELINAELAEHNCEHDYPSPSECGGGDGGPDTGNDSADGGSSGGVGADGGGSGSGCGCATDTRPSGIAVLLLVCLGGLASRRRW